jgi:hypothetical protein
MKIRKNEKPKLRALQSKVLRLQSELSQIKKVLKSKKRIDHRKTYISGGS